jgi:hypothetical protein
MSSAPCVDGATAPPDLKMATRSGPHRPARRVRERTTCRSRDEVNVVGSVAKGVSYEGLLFGTQDGRWTCQATVDV